MESRLKYPKYARELEQLLEDDQREWRAYAKAAFEAGDTEPLKAWHDELRYRVTVRTSRMLAILRAIGEPTLQNIGDEGSLAMSVLATHGSLAASKRVLKAFMNVYKRDKNQVRYQSIPAMADWVRILERQPQVFGTIWFTDSSNYPFLPVTEDVTHINERRAAFGIEPFRWPKSLAMPESEQPWLQEPLERHVMREPSEEEYRKNAGDFM